MATGSTVRRAGTAIFGCARRIGGMNATCAAWVMLVGGPSLLYPLGRDQGLFFYAAREWLLRGQVMYRDLWDQKPPVIYLVYMGAMSLMGERVAGIRVLELFVAVPALSWCGARLSAPARGEAPRGTFGAAWLGVALFYYGYFTFWDTGQCELWTGLFAALALVAALRDRCAGRGAAVSGALSAITLFTKPPALLFVLIAAVAVLVRARDEAGGARVALRRLSAWVAAALVTSGTILGYFAAEGALPAMIDILVHANAVYVANERLFHTPSEIFDAITRRFQVMQPFTAIFVGTIVLALFVAYARRDGALARRYAFPALLAVAAFAAVVSQLKFYDYHWGIFVLPAALFAATLYGDLCRVAATRPSRAAAPALFVAGAVCSYALAGASSRAWFDNAVRTARYVRGDVSRAEFARGFDVPFFYAYHDAEMTGLWLRRHARPGDTLVVRGFEPEVYAVSGLHFTGRFFWTAFLTMPTREYRREELLTEDYRAIARNPPRFAVTLTAAPGGVDSSAWFTRFGFAPRIVFGSFTILERSDAAS